MDIRPINDGCLATVAAMLKNGFPERSATFWDDALRRLMGLYRDGGIGPIGYLMTVGDSPAGIILTFDSRRGDRRIVNLSSWYVEDKYRWLAPRMLQRVVADEAAVYTDQSPTAETVRINEKLGFRTVSETVLVFFLPWTAVAGGRSAEVIGPDRLPAGALSPADHAMLAAHRDLGCICAAIRHDGRYSPLILARTWKNGLPVARLVFAESRRLVAGASASLARLLLRSGILLMTLHAGRDEQMPTALTWKHFAPVQVKGEWRGDKVDLAFSESVFLRL